MMKLSSDQMQYFRMDSGSFSVSALMATTKLQEWFSEIWLSWTKKLSSAYGWALVSFSRPSMQTSVMSKLAASMPLTNARNVSAL